MAGDTDGGEVGDVTLAKHGEDAYLEAVVVRVDCSNGSVSVRWSGDGLAILAYAQFSMLLIVLGGRGKKLEAASICSLKSMIVKGKAGLVVRRVRRLRCDRLKFSRLRLDCHVGKSRIEQERV